MLEKKQIDDIQHVLFSDENLNTYAVIDGAACPELRFKIYDWEPESSCLWSGELEPDLQEVAPYMVKLEKNSEFALWLLQEGWHKHWNIFVQSKLNPKDFRKQIRKLQLVRSPEGKNLVFRFYDPRVLEIFIPTCDEEQNEELFEGVHSFLYVSQETSGLQSARFSEEIGIVSISECISSLESA